MEGPPQSFASTSSRREENFEEDQMEETTSGGDEEEESEELLPDFLGNLPRFEQFRRSMALTDVVFRGLTTSQDTEAADLHAHKVILAVASPYFEDLFKDGKDLYEIPFAPEILEEILTFIYTGRLPGINEDSLENVMILADIFQLPELFSRCKQALRRILNVGNYKRFENIIKRFPTGDDTIMQFICADFGNYSQSPEFLRLSFEKVEEIVKHRDPGTGPIPSGSMLQGILTWVQAEIHNRQKHLLNLMQFVNLEDVPAEMMKRCMITLNTSYRKEKPTSPTPSTSSGMSMTFHSESPLEEPTKELEPVKTPSENAEEKGKKRKKRRKTVPGDDATEGMKELFEKPADPMETPEQRAASTEKIANELKVFIRKEGNKGARVVLHRASLELPKKRTHTDSEVVESVKKARISKSSEGLEQRTRTRSASSKHHAESGVDYVSGNGIPNISIGHPLMFYVSQNAEDGDSKDIMVYDFTSKEAGVLIENACIDKPRCQMAYLNRRLYLIGGKSDPGEAQGVQTHHCLDTVLYFSDFPKITDTGLLRSVKWLGKTPIYARDSLQEARSDCGVVVWENAIYAIGGRGENPSIIRSLNSCEKFNAGGSGWSKVKPMSKNRENFGVGTLRDSIYAVGGWISCTSTSCSLGMVERYTPELDQWNISAPLLTRRCSVRVATVDSCLYAIGGSEKIEGPGKLGNIEFYDPRVKHWMPIKARSAMPVTCREGAVATLDGKIISVECNTDEINGRPLIEVFDLRQRKWYTDGTLPTNGFFSSATFMNMTP